MNKNQTKQIEIQKSVMDVMEKNLSKWQSIEEMRKNYDLFIRNIKKIDDYLAEVKADPASLKKKMLRSKKELIRHLSPVIGVLEVYAGDSGNKKLVRLAASGIDDLKRLKAGALTGYCRQVLKAINSLTEKQAAEAPGGPDRMISDYGLTLNHLEKLKEASDQHAADIKDYRNSRDEIRKSRSGLERRIRENSKIVKRRMDPIMLLFRDSHRDFHDAYFSSR
jgi:hypothetical protein